MTSFQALGKNLIPVEEVAGLEISESFCRVILLSRQNLSIRLSAEVPLQPGTIAGGEVKNSARLTEALLLLKKQAGKHFEKHPAVIVSLSAANFYTHVLDLPDLPEESYEEAVRLNALQVSPINLEESYFDWQNLGVNLRTLEREFLITVALKSKISPFIESLRQAGIEPLAIEPSSLGLIRLLNYFAATAEKNAPHIIVHIGKDGLNFVITKEGKLFFDLYSYWSQIEEARDGTVSRQDFERILIRETTKLIMFYRTHYREEVTQAVLLSPVLKTELAEALKQTFKLKVVGLRFPVKNGEPISDLWAGTLSVALRGTIPRADDNIVSMMPTGTELAYARMRFNSFMSLWTKIGIGTLLGLLLFTGASTFMLLEVRQSLERAFGEIQKTTSATESRELQTEAERFNALMGAALQAETNTLLLSPVIEPLIKSAEINGIRLHRISVSVTAKEIRLLSGAPTRQNAISFKRALEDSKAFSAVELPLNSFSETIEGVNFAMHLTIK